MDLLNSLPDIEVLKKLFGDAVTAEFTKTCAIFGFAAMIHAKQVRKEIKAQFGALVSVLREDLDAQKSVLAGLAVRVNNIELRLKNKSSQEELQ